MSVLVVHTVGKIVLSEGLSLACIHMHSSGWGFSVFDIDVRLCPSYLVLAVCVICCQV